MGKQPFAQTPSAGYRRKVEVFCRMLDERMFNLRGSRGDGGFHAVVDYACRPLRQIASVTLFLISLRISRGSSILVT